MWAPGLFGLVMGASVLLALKDSPEDLGAWPGGTGWVRVRWGGAGVPEEGGVGRGGLGWGREPLHDELQWAIGSLRVVIVGWEGGCVGWEGGYVALAPRVAG